jgi:hypothetical protein
MSTVGTERVCPEYVVLQFLNAMFAETGALKVVDLREKEQETQIFDAQTSQGESLSIQIERLTRHQFREWTPSVWKPYERSEMRRVIVQICDFICTNNEHAHSVYRFFGPYGERNRQPHLEVHVIELPKMALRHLEETEYEQLECSLHAMLEAFKWC